jgi:hypothetical protein
MRFGPQRQCAAKLASVLLLAVSLCAGAAGAQETSLEQAPTAAPQNEPAKELLDGYAHLAEINRQIEKSAEALSQEYKAAGLQQDAQVKALSQLSANAPKFDPTGEVQRGSEMALQQALGENIKRREAAAGEDQLREVAQDVALSNAIAKEKQERSRRQIGIALGIAAVIVLGASVLVIGILLPPKGRSLARVAWGCFAVCVAAVMFVVPPQETVFGSVRTFEGWGPIWNLGYDPERSAVLSLAFPYLLAQWGLLLTAVALVVVMWRTDKTSNVTRPAA